MKSLKKTLVLLVVLSMILSAVSPVFAFNDVIDEAYEEQANKMAAFGVFAGDANGNFNADAEITRAEMAVIIGKLMGLTENEANANKVYASAFSDVAAGEWYTGWINLAAGRGIISGFPDGTFRPNEKVTQAQAVTMIVKALGWGVVVDQTGTWPANYITKASELRLFKNAVDTNSELVTRGNVAIYCYNALTAKTWDVVESTDGSLTSSSKGETILAKYFSDFVNEDGKMKLVEDATVTLSGAVSSAIGANQIRIDATIGTETIDEFIDAEGAPRKGKEDVTYAKDDGVVAYVPAEVANIASLTGKKVDVIFGKDNEVAYLVVTDDSYEDEFITAFDADEREIEINGEVYELAPSVTVKVFGYELTAKDTKDAKIINTLLTSNFALSNVKKGLTRNIVVDYILNGDDEIETVDLQFSFDGFAQAVKVGETTGTLKVNEFVVEKISSKNALTAVGNNTDSMVSFHNDLDDYEDTDPRVIKNGEVAEVADIEAGDVVTEIIIDSALKLMLVTANTVEGTVEDLNKNALTISGEDYKVVAKPVYNEEGEIDDYSDLSTAENVYKVFEDADVTAYLNVVGEVVAVVGESEATGTVLGVVTSVPTDEYDEDNEVDYVKAKILAEDGSNKFYKIYKNSKKNKDVTVAALGLAINDVVIFEANSDRIIVAEDIAKVLTTDTDENTANPESYDFKAYSDVEVTTTVGSVVYDDKTIGDKRFSSSTVVINPYEKELITNWNIIAERTDAFVPANKEVITATEYAALTDKTGWAQVSGDANAYEKALATSTYIFTEGKKIVYIVSWVDEYYYGASDEQYGILLDVRKDKDEDDETIYVATVLVDGEEVEYECEQAVRAYDEGEFISFKVTEGEFKANPAKLISQDLVDAVANAASDSATITLSDAYAALENINKFKTTLPGTKAYALNTIKVDAVEVVDGETYIEFEDTSAVNLAKDYIVYDLEAQEMADEITKGDYVLVVDYDADEKGFEIVVIL